jgi:hypothetical protein
MLQHGHGAGGSELNSKRMRFFPSQARKPIRLPSNARKRRAATKWRATGVSRRRDSRAQVRSALIAVRRLVRMNMKNDAKGCGVREMPRRETSLLRKSRSHSEGQNRRGTIVGGPMTMIDGQVVVALAEAFFLGIVFGSGLEVLVRDGR